MDELRDIKPLVPLSDPVPAWIWALVALVASSLLVLLWRRTRRKTVDPLLLSEAEAARRALEAVRGFRPRDRISAERLQSHIAIVLRRWLEARSEVHATDMTTEELEADPRLAKVLGNEGRATLVAILTFADAVRFAGRSATEDEHRESVERASALVRGRA